MVDTYYSPNACAYAAIRLDPVAVVSHLNDPQSSLEAQALRPQTYLIYLDYVRMIHQVSSVFSCLMHLFCLLGVHVTVSREAVV